MGNYVKKKKEMVFQSVDSLQQVVNVVNEAAMAVNDKTRTIRHSAIPEVLTGALGAGNGGVGSFLALYGLGTVGLSAAESLLDWQQQEQSLVVVWLPVSLFWLRP